MFKADLLTIVDSIVTILGVSFISLVFFRFTFQSCLDLFKYRDYRFLSVVLLVLCIFFYLCSLEIIIYEL